eukprot:Rhum_TRINITY_DN13711_c0_g1::Rhum_TRINITY_DN13711_c0_g1_i3::g.63292::m.63292
MLPMSSNLGTRPPQTVSVLMKKATKTGKAIPFVNVRAASNYAITPLYKNGDGVLLRNDSWITASKMETRSLRTVGTRRAPQLAPGSEGARKKECTATTMENFTKEGYQYAIGVASKIVLAHYGL